MKTPLLKAIARGLFAIAVGAGASLQAQVVDKTPVLHLSFDNVSGTTVINGGSGGLGMNGTLNGGASVVSGGKFGNALQVIGTNSWDASCRIANAVVPLNVVAGNAWTVAMWIKGTNAGGTWAYQGAGGWAANNTTLFMAVNNGTSTSQGTTAGGVRYGQGWQVGTATVNDDLWHHIVITFDGTTKVQYVDGVVDAWAANGWAVGSADTGAGTQFWIGGAGTGQGDGQRCLNGLIDEAYVFNQALNASDIQGMYASNGLPIIPVSVAINPTSGYRGTARSVLVTATVTPVNGAVTNVTANLSAFGLSSALKLSALSANVFTNTFTVPALQPVGVTNLTVTAVANADPFVGSGGATYTVIARPPTNASIVTQIANVSAYDYNEASFRFVATNDNPRDTSFPMTYSWYTNGVLVSTNAMGPYYTFLANPSDNGMLVQAIARVADTNFSSISVTSTVATLTVNTGSLVYTNGLKREFFAGANRAAIKVGNVAPGVVDIMPQMETPGGLGANYGIRYSGYFIPPTTEAYVFFVCSDDGTDLFISTDENPLNKQMVAQEVGWTATLNWNNADGGGSIISQKRSDQYTNSAGITNYPAGISMVAGQRYYIEAVFENYTGGDNFAVTCATMTELATTPLANGVNTVLAATNNNIALISYPGTVINWATQPANKTVFEGDTAIFTAVATNNSEMTATYEWYVKKTTDSDYVLQPGSASTNLALTLVAMDLNGALIQAVSRTRITGLSTTSTVATLTVNAAVWEPGFVKIERFGPNTTRQQVNNGSAGLPVITMVVPSFEMGIDNATGQDNFARRISGFFVAPYDFNYDFLITADDDTDLFVSTDHTAVNKQLVAQEAGWSASLNWGAIGGGSISIVSQKRSDQWTNSAGFAPYAAGISMIRSNKYYIEAAFHQGGGNANVAASYKYTGGTFPANGTRSILRGSVIGINAERSLWVNYTLQPTNVSVAPMGFGTFAVAGTTDSKMNIGAYNGFENLYTNNFLYFQWMKDGVDIPGANSALLRVGPLLPSDNGAVIQCKIRSFGYANDSLEPIWSNSVPVTIAVSGQVVYETGVAQVEWYTGGTIAQVEAGTTASNANFIYSVPKLIAPSTSQFNNYANRVSTWFTPPADGYYSFFVNSDDGANVYLSTNDSSFNKEMICRETASSSGVLNWPYATRANVRYSDQFVNPVTGLQKYSSGIPLVGGQKYYLEVVHADGTGGDYAAVTYTAYGAGTPANGTDTALQGNVIGFYVPRVASVGFLEQPQSQSVVSGPNSVTFSARGTNTPATVMVGDTGNPQVWFTNANYLQYQWYTNGTAVPGATAKTFTLYPVLPSYNNYQVRCDIRTLGYANSSLTPIWSNGVPATLTVTPETTPPTFVYAATFENTNRTPQYIVNVTFSEWMNAASITNPARYTGLVGNITNFSIADNNRTVSLFLDAPQTLPLNITISGVTDLSGNLLAGSPITTNVNTQKLTFTDIGTATDPAYPSKVWINGNGSYIISAQGSDIWNNTDGFNFAWEMKTNDFDMVVRGVRIGKTSYWSKAGLMARQDLTAGSRHWSMINGPAAVDGYPYPDNNNGLGANNVEGIRRITNNLATGAWDQFGGARRVMVYPNAWLRLTRVGQVFNGYLSTNGRDWTLTAIHNTATNDTPVPAEMYVGLCTTAHNNDTISTPPPAIFLYYNTAEYADYNSSYVPAPRLTISQVGADLSISWTPAGGTLQVSPAISGPDVNWVDVGTSNPATVLIGSGNQFYRVVRAVTP